MNRITHKQIEEQGLITDPIQLRIYNYLKVFKNVWFCDSPFYIRIEDGKKKTYTTEFNYISNIKACDRNDIDKSVDRIITHLDSLLKQCDLTNNVLLISILSSGLWVDGDIVYDSFDFEQCCKIAFRYVVIPRINGGIDIEIDGWGESPGVEPIPQKNYYYLIRRRKKIK